MNRHTNRRPGPPKFTPADCLKANAKSKDRK